MITLSSDFGSPYPAAMKGVILGRSEARLVDVAHDFPRQNVRAAAFWLRETLPWFPPAVHLVVIDPGVGTDRAALVVRAGDHLLVGPDNGVLRPAVRRLSDGGPVAAYEIDDADAASATFHGRDVFAPAAARVHDAAFAEREGKGEGEGEGDIDADRLQDLDRLTGVAVESLVDCRLPEADVDGDRARGEVLAVDDFGNVITNVPGDFLSDLEAVRVDGARVAVGETFAAVAPGERLATVGSHGNVELDVNRGRGDDAFDLGQGDAFELRAV